MSSSLVSTAPDGLPVDISALQMRIQELERQLAARDGQPVDFSTDLAQSISETRLQVALEVTGAGCFDLDLTTGALWLSDQYLSIIGYTPGEHIFTVDEWMAMGHPDDASIVLPQVDACLSGQAQSYQAETRLRHKDGSWIWVTGQGRVVTRDDDGHATRLIGTISDITSRRAIEERRRQLEQLVEHAPVGLALADQQGYLRYANPACESNYGYAEGLVGKHYMDLMAPGERERLALALDGETPAATWAGQVYHQRQDGSTFPVQVASVALQPYDGMLSGAAAILRDLTAEKEAEQERLALQEQVIEAQQAALRELSTPLIPLAEGVVVMPLIGSIDSGRAQQVIETLLEGVAATSATTAILDITGVPVVDTQIANGLIRAAQAVKLLGARVVLTGIRPEVAQTLVGLGADLSSITTQSSLQAGIALALRQK